MKSVIVLTGPTGIGKSDWALRLAQSHPIEIVSCDSAQVYRGLDIGTAKPDAQARVQVPHHLIDLRDPAQRYSAGEFVPDALAAIEAIHSRGRTPCIVGGTMLYLRSLVEGIAPLPRADALVRAHLDARAAQEGWEALHDELARIDPRAASRIHPNDPQRIQRALEVHELSGRTLSDWHAETTSRMWQYRIIGFALMPAQREWLHARIAMRFESMLKSGWLDEVRGLHERGDLDAELPSIRSVGYRQLWQHLDGECTLTVAMQRGIVATRQLAKRQMTWLKSMSWLKKIDPLRDDSYAEFARAAASADDPAVI